MTNPRKPRSVFRSTLVLLCACLTLAACDDKKAEGGDAAAKQAEIKWPAKPGDGSNVALEMVEVQDDGATFKVYNFADADLTDLSIRQRFLDADGKELDTFPHMAVGAPTLVAKKSMAEIKTVIMEKPAGMKTVEGVIRKAKFSDGTEWRPES